MAPFLFLVFACNTCKFGFANVFFEGSGFPTAECANLVVSTGFGGWELFEGRTFPGGLLAKGFVCAVGLLNFLGTSLVVLTVFLGGCTGTSPSSSSSES